MSKSKATLCVHAGSQVTATPRSVVAPIHASTSFLFSGDGDEVVYPRYFNVPNQEIVGSKIATLENAEQGLVLSSGMAAIVAVLLGLLKKDDHAIFHSGIYGGTRSFVAERLPQYGIDFSLVRECDVDAFARQIRDETKLVFFESPTNPLLQIVDIRKLTDLARERGIVTVMDNTFATPILQNPTDAGVDIVVHSGTKYLNGHSDVNCGAIATSRALMAPILSCATQLGGTLDVRGCYLLERGLKTLSLRVERQCQNAAQLAVALDQHPRIAKVHFPGLPDHVGHQVAAQQMKGFGAMLAFELKGTESEVKTVLQRLQIAQMAVSLGGVETLVCLPKDTSHAKIDAREQQEAGISDTLVRVSVGIEDADDLLADFDQALRG